MEELTDKFAEETRTTSDEVQENENDITGSCQPLPEEKSLVDIYFDLLWARVTFTQDDILTMDQESYTSFMAAAQLVRDTEFKLLIAGILQAIEPDRETLSRTEAMKRFAGRMR